MADMLTPTAVAVLVCGCLPPLGIGVIWYLAGWIGSYFDGSAASQPKGSDAQVVADPPASYSEERDSHAVVRA